MKRILYRLATDQANGPLPGMGKFFLWMLSCLYGAGVRMIVFLYARGILRRRRLDRPVISVGNITVGGTGKTPCVIRLTQWLRQKDLRPVVLTRGYMDQGGAASCPAGSDEALMLRNALPGVPVLVGHNRFQNARDFLKDQAADIFILDDGFQHWRLARDVDIVVLDAVHPWGNGHLMPRGILREPLSALQRADIIVVTKTNLSTPDTLEEIRERLAILCPDKMIVRARHQPVALVDMRSDKVEGLAFLKGKEICSVCGIGDPASFEKILTDLGAHIKEPIAFMDHYSYNIQDIRRIGGRCQSKSIDTIVTTEKDAVKLTPFLGGFDSLGVVRLLYLKIQMAFEGNEDEFLKRVTDFPQR